MTTPKFKSPKKQFKLDEGMVDYYARVSQTLHSGFGSDDEKGEPGTLFTHLYFLQNKNFKNLFQHDIVQGCRRRSRRSSERHTTFLAEHAIRHTIFFFRPQLTFNLPCLIASINESRLINEIIITTRNLCHLGKGVKI